MRNVLFVLVDCLRADAVAADNRASVTPAIDQLVSRGTYFSQAISTTSTTTPCVATMLTGSYPAAHGIRALSGYKLNSECITLPQLLKKHGYHTYALVSGPLSPITGLNRGFDQYEYRTARIPQDTGKVYLCEEWGEDLRRRFTEGAFREPWFIFLHLWEIHKPRKITGGFDSQEFGTDPYERAVSSLDPELGRLFELAGKDTAIILHGDHGESREVIRQNPLLRFYHRMKRRLAYPVDPRLYRSGHGFHVYDFLVRVPLLFAGAGIFPEGKVIADQVRQIDIFPTLADALGLDISLPVHGRSLLPLVRGESLPKLPAVIEAVGTRNPNPKNKRLGIRTPEWKYVFAPQNPRIPEELYCLQADPHERQNVAKTQRSVTEELARQLAEIVDATSCIKGQRQSSDEPMEGEMSEEENKIMEQRLKELGYL